MSKSLLEISKNSWDHEPVIYEPIYMNDEYERNKEITEGLYEE
jgi:hypothetical protein